MNAKPWYDLNDLEHLDPKWNSEIKRGLLFNGSFSERNRLNIPGPFYGGQTDNCLTGHPEAPENVMFDIDGYEFVYRQPRDLDELENLLRAAYFDPFDGYGADGNKHWTLSLIRDWWKSHHSLLAEAESLRTLEQNVDAWQQYLMGPAIDYLRQYAFFIEEGKLPGELDHLPRL